MPDLPGTTTVIEGYSRGLRDREIRESRIERTKLALEAQKLRQQQIDNAKSQFEAKLDQDRELAQARTALQAAGLELQRLKFKVETYEKANQGILDVDPKTGDFKPTARGTAQKQAEDIKTQGAVNLQTKLNPILIERALAGIQARGNQQAQLSAQGARQQLENQRILQRERFNFQREENAKNRAAMLERANIALSGRLALKQQDKQDIINATTDNVFPEVLTGNMTLQDLNKTMMGNAKALTLNELKARGVTPLNDDQRNELRAFPLIQNYYKKLNELKDIVNNASDPRMAHLNNDYHKKRQEIMQELDAIGRAFKGFKAAITEADTKRLEGGIPSTFPGGKYALLDSAEGIRQSNQARVNAVEDWIIEKFNLLTKGKSPVQTEAIREQFGVNPLSDRQKLKRRQKFEPGSDWERSK